MSVTTQIVTPVADRVAERQRRPTTRSSRSCSPPTCSGRTARSRTSAAATPPPRAPRRPRRPRDPGDLGQGLGQRSGDDVASDFTPLRLDEVLPLFERDEMSDEDMVAHLARCQLDPAAPRSSIETLLHAFIPAAHVHHTHPDAINVLACANDGRKLIAECFGERPRGSVHPPRLRARQAGRRSGPGETPAPAGRARQARADHLGRHREKAYERTVGVCNQAAEFVNSTTHGRRDSVARACAHAARHRRAPRRCARSCRPCAARCRASARRSCSPICRRPCSSSSTEQAPPMSRTSAPPAPITWSTPRCSRCWSRTSRRATGSRISASGSSPAARVPRELRGVLRAPPRARHEPADPDARVVLIQNVGLVAVGPPSERRSCPATSITARSRSWPEPAPSPSSSRSTRPRASRSSTGRSSCTSSHLHRLRVSFREKSRS